MKPRKCEMCGAPLVGWKCEYCGTSYDSEGQTVRMYKELNEAKFAVASHKQAQSFFDSSLELCESILSQLADAINASGAIDEARQADGYGMED